eukprot:2729618-Rhodomonas_salina.3
MVTESLGCADGELDRVPPASDQQNLFLRRHDRPLAAMQVPGGLSHGNKPVCRFSRERNQEGGWERASEEGSERASKQGEGREGGTGGAEGRERARQTETETETETETGKKDARPAFRQDRAPHMSHLQSSL